MISGTSLMCLRRYGTLCDHAEVSPVSKPSPNSPAQQVDVAYDTSMGVQPEGLVCEYHMCQVEPSKETGAIKVKPGSTSMIGLAVLLYQWMRSAEKAYPMLCLIVGG